MDRIKRFYVKRERDRRSVRKLGNHHVEGEWHSIFNDRRFCKSRKSLPLQLCAWSSSNNHRGQRVDLPLLDPFDLPRLRFWTNLLSINHYSFSFQSPKSLRSLGSQKFGDFQGTKVSKIWERGTLEILKCENSHRNSHFAMWSLRIWELWHAETCRSEHSTVQEENNLERTEWKFRNFTNLRIKQKFNVGNLENPELDFAFNDTMLQSKYVLPIWIIIYTANAISFIAIQGTR